MKFTDKELLPINDGDVLLFQHKDSVEKTGFNSYVTPVALCYWSIIEQRFIPFSSLSPGGIVSDSIIVGGTTEYLQNFK